MAVPMGRQPSHHSQSLVELVGSIVAQRREVKTPMETA